MKKNIKGTILWFILSIIIGVISMPIMIGREIYQYHKYLKPCNIGFEWDDIIRYGIFTGIGSLWHWFILDQLFENHPWWLNL